MGTPRAYVSLNALTTTRHPGPGAVLRRRAAADASDAVAVQPSSLDGAEAAGAAGGAAAGGGVAVVRGGDLARRSGPAVRRAVRRGDDEPAGPPADRPAV